LVDANNVCFYPSIITNRWLAVWLENIGNLVIEVLVQAQVLAMVLV
jgi:hypothetical protein